MRPRPVTICYLGKHLGPGCAYVARLFRNRACTGHGVTGPRTRRAADAMHGSCRLAVHGLLDRPDYVRLVAMRVNARRLAERELDREKTYAAFADWIETVRGGG
jgi:hypothetical protein